MEDVKKAFDELQPVCVLVAKEQSRDAVRSLLEQLRKTVRRSDLQKIQDYLLFPLRLILKQQKKLSNELYADVCCCISLILSNSKVTKWGTFQDLFNTFCIMLSSPINHEKVVPLPEELKLAIVESLRAVVKNTELCVVLENLYTVKMLPFLGHAVSLMLALAEKERARNLRISAMQLLVDLSQTDVHHSQSTRILIGDIFASFIPRISVVLCHIITGDTKQGQDVTMVAIETWRKLVGLVMDDTLVKHSQNSNQKYIDTAIEDKRLQSLLVVRSLSWVKSTAEKLNLLVKQIAAVKRHSKWRVRQALVEWAEHFICHCSCTMTESVPYFLEVLVTLLSDEYANVASKSQRTLELFSRHSQEHESRPLLEILEESLLSLVTSLPRQMRIADDEQKLSLIKLLSGYLTILGEHVNCLLYSSTHLERFSLALLQVFELDCSDVKIVEERTPVIGQGTVHSGWRSEVQTPRKYFKHFHDDQIHKELRNVCQQLGSHGDLDVIVDHFLDLFHETSLHRMQATLILNEVLLGNVQKEKSAGSDENKSQAREEKTKQVVRILVEEYLNPANFCLVTCHCPDSSSISQENRSPSSLSGLIVSKQELKIINYNKNIVQICLFLEGFGCFAQVLKEEFKPFLIEVLYPLLEKLGNESSYLSSTAYLALMDICMACGYRSIEELIQLNADYLVNAISLKLRHLPQYPQTPRVLKVIIQYSYKDILPLIEDTVLEITECLDEYYTDYVTTLMPVLHELCSAVIRWFPAQKKKRLQDNDSMPAEKQEEKESKIIKEIECFFLDYHRQKQMAEGNVDDDLTSVDSYVNSGLHDAEVDVEADEDKTDKNLPHYVTTVKEVLVRSRHLLSHQNVKLRLLVLDVVGQAALALQDYEDELLPLIHSLWNPFVQRFVDREMVVILKAYSTLTQLAQVCGDFLRKRTFKDVFPKMTSFLLKQARISMKSRQAYTYTLAYKLQLLMLTSGGPLCLNLGLEENEVDGVATACLPYLSVHQPEVLQKASIKMFECLISMEPDAMWLKLCSIYCPVVYGPPPSADLSAVKMMESVTADLVQMLLQSRHLQL